MISTFDDTDLRLFHCPDNPGLMYGWTEVGHETSRPAVGTSVTKIWQNPITTFGPPPAGYPMANSIGNWILFSKGTVTSNSSTGWFTPGGAPIAMATDAWSDFGSSGSLAFLTSSGQAIIGPQSTGVADGSGVWSLSMVDYNDVVVATHEYPQTIISGSPPNYNLPTDYRGLMADSDGDNVFDIQKDLERSFPATSFCDRDPADLPALPPGGGTFPPGPYPNTAPGAGVQSALCGTPRIERDHMVYKPSSYRSNALWDVDPAAVEFQPSQGQVHVDASTPVGSLGEVVMTLEGHSLRPGRLYRVSLWVNTVSASKTFGLRVNAGSGTAGQIRTNHNPGWRLHTFTLYTSGGPSNIQPEIIVDGDYEGYLGPLVFVESGSVMDFDIHDKREYWHNDTTGDWGTILPDGVAGILGENSFAGAVVRNTSGVDPSGGDWPLRNRALAFQQGMTYRICFDHRRAPWFAGAFSGSNSAWFKVVSGGDDRQQLSFAPGASWSNRCTGIFSASDSDTQIMFGIDGTPSTAVDANPAYLVDNIEIVAEPGPVVQIGGTGTLEDDTTASVACSIGGEECSATGEGELEDGCSISCTNPSASMQVTCEPGSGSHFSQLRKRVGSGGWTTVVSHSPPSATGATATEASTPSQDVEYECQYVP
ncbi:MAG: hypothetical protein AAGD10_12135 [Myxococcota bacterium]